MKESDFIYLDNAATTVIDNSVKQAMIPYFIDEYGNPSSIYKHGKKTKNAIEKARNTVASLLGTVPGEVFFTSGGTESNNTALIGSVVSRKIKHIISTKVEHHAVLQTLEYLQKYFDTQIHNINISKDGQLDMNHFVSLVQKYPKALVSIMNANNEIGNINDIVSFSEISKVHDCIFHTDAVQTIGHTPFNFSKLNVDFATASSHKFHGPKGTGVLLKNGELDITPLIHGGGQERNFRAGTENIMGIVGFTKALEISINEMDERKKIILGLKKETINLLKNKINGIEFNGLSYDTSNNKSLYTILNVNIPYHGNPDMLLFNFDIAGVALSGGSACSSGSFNKSHVITEIKGENKGFVPIRISFSHFNTSKEINKMVDILVSLLESKKKVK